MEDFPRAKEGREHTFALLSPFSPCEGGVHTGGDDGDIIMIIVLSIFYVLGLQANTSPKSKCAGRKNHTQGLATGL